MRAARLACACALAALLTGFGPCEDEERVRALEAKRDALLQSTVPKSELWTQLQRKGAALQAAQPLEKQRAARAARAESESASEGAWRAQEDELHALRGEVDAQRAQLESEFAQAQAETSHRQQTLDRFASRHLQTDPAP